MVKEDSSYISILLQYVQTVITDYTHLLSNIAM